MAARCPRGLVLGFLFTSLLTCPPPLVAQTMRYEYDALGRLTGVRTPEGVAIGATESLTRVGFSDERCMTVSLWMAGRASPVPRPSARTAGYSEGSRGVGQ